MPAADVVSAVIAAKLSLPVARQRVVQEFERRYILGALKRHRGNVTRAAETLGLERSNLYRKLKSYGIEVERE